MRRIQMQATLWTMLLAVPFTILAIFGSAYLTLHLFDIATRITNLFNETTYIGRPFIVVFFERLPELVGMGAGMLVMMALLFLFRPVRNGQEPK